MARICHSRLPPDGLATVTVWGPSIEAESGHIVAAGEWLLDRQ